MYPSVSTRVEKVLGKTLVRINFVLEARKLQYAETYSKKGKARPTVPAWQLHLPYAIRSHSVPKEISNRSAEQPRWVADFEWRS